MGCPVRYKTPYCRVCKIKLNAKNWYPSQMGCQNHICRNCQNRKATEWQTSHPEKVKEINKKSRLVNHDKIKDRRKERYESNKGMFHDRAKRFREKNRVKINEHQKVWKQETKFKVISHYSPKIECANCGISDLLVLTLHHINNDGALHRKAVGNGISLYRWIIKNGYPPMFQVLCMNCNWKERHMNRRMPEEMIDEYSGGGMWCVRCHTKDRDVMTLDHINGGGKEERRRLKKFGWVFYQWLKSKGYPRGYQILCFNCQFIKRAEKKECIGAKNRLPPHV